MFDFDYQWTRQTDNERDSIECADHDLLRTMCTYVSSRFYTNSYHWYGSTFLECSIELVGVPTRKKRSSSIMFIPRLLTSCNKNKLSVNAFDAWVTFITRIFLYQTINAFHVLKTLIDIHSPLDATDALPEGGEHFDLEMKRWTPTKNQWMWWSYLHQSNISTVFFGEILQRCKFHFFAWSIVTDTGVRNREVFSATLFVAHHSEIKRRKVESSPLRP